MHVRAPFGVCSGALKRAEDQPSSLMKVAWYLLEYLLGTRPGMAVGHCAFCTDWTRLTIPSCRPVFEGIFEARGFPHQKTTVLFGCRWSERAHHPAEDTTPPTTFRKMGPISAAARRHMPPHAAAGPQNRGGRRCLALKCN